MSIKNCSWKEGSGFVAETPRLAANRTLTMLSSFEIITMVWSIAVQNLMKVAGSHRNIFRRLSAHVAVDQEKGTQFQASRLPRWKYTDSRQVW